MHRLTRTLALIATVAVTSHAGAYPEGAPWGAADPDARETCATCHYDYEPVRDSPAVRIDGLPDDIVTSATYTLHVTLASAEARTSGFQLLLFASDNSVLDSDDADVEIGEAGARSTRPRAVNAGTVSWTLRWTPASTDEVTAYLAASAANDDQSAFGDRIHYRRFDLSDAEP